jgi:tetratricopeptide (TPR) repeat protein
MGSAHLKPTALAEPTSAFPFRPTNLAVWLDGLMVTLASGVIAPWHADEVWLRLKDIPFEAILPSVERAGPDIGVYTEISLCEQWIGANKGTSPLLYAAWFNLGVLFTRAGNCANAAIACRNALALRPDMHGAAINLGLPFKAAGQQEQALATWNGAAQRDEARIAWEIQRGRLLEKLGRFIEADSILRRVLVTNPGQLDVIHHWVTAVRLANDPTAYARYKDLFTEQAWSQTIGDIAGLHDRV